MGLEQLGAHKSQVRVTCFTIFLSPLPEKIFCTQSHRASLPQWVALFKYLMSFHSWAPGMRILSSFMNHPVLFFYISIFHHRSVPAGNIAGDWGARRGQLPSQAFMIELPVLALSQPCCSLDLQGTCVVDGPYSGPWPPEWGVVLLLRGSGSDLYALLGNLQLLESPLLSRWQPGHVIHGTHTLGQ